MKRLALFIIALTVCLGLVFVSQCTLQSDNGGLVSVTPPPSDSTGTPVQYSDSINYPIILVYTDSTYIRKGDTLLLQIRVLKDTLYHPLTSTWVKAFSTQGKIWPDSVRTNSSGFASFRFTDSITEQAILNFSCRNTRVSSNISVMNNTTDKIQRRLQVWPERVVLRADGHDSTLIRARVLNDYNNPIIGQAVQFITTSGVIAGINPPTTSNSAGQAITGTDGFATALLSSINRNDTATVTAFLLSDHSKIDQTKIVFQGVTIQAKVTASNLHIGERTTITATVLNGANSPIPFSSIQFLLGKATSSNLSIVSQDSITGFQGTAQATISGNIAGTDSVIIYAAGTVTKTKINVTQLTLTATLNETVLQARPYKSTTMHVTFTGAGNLLLANKSIAVVRHYLSREGADTTDTLQGTTNANGQCDFSINALSYECSMILEVIETNSATDIATISKQIDFITTRNITVYATPAVIQADGTSKSQITVQIKNEDNNPLINEVVTFTSDVGMITASDSSNDQGKVTAFLTSDRRNTTATVTATLVKDPSKKVVTQVDFVGVTMQANANPPSINSSGTDTSFVQVSLVDPAGNAIVGERINFSKILAASKICAADSVTNNRGEARCKVVGTGTGKDTIKAEAAGAIGRAVINYASNFLTIDTAVGQTLYANGRDSTLIILTYRTGDRTTPINNAVLEVSATLGSISDTVFASILRTGADGKDSFYIRNPGFANTANIFVSAKTASEVTTAAFSITFRASQIARIELSGTPEVISTNGDRAKITAVAYDATGNRVKNEVISFNLARGTSGGEYLDPPTARTSIDGVATTYLVSGQTPSFYKTIWIVAGDFSTIKSDTVKFTIAGPPHAITIRRNILKGTDFKDGTFGLPCAAIVTDVNGNPVADGTEVSFSLKISGYVYRTLVPNFVNTSSFVNASNSCEYHLDTLFQTLPFEDFNDNHILDPGEDRNSDGKLNRGEDINGDGFYNQPLAFRDINGDGIRQHDAFSPVEQLYPCYSGFKRLVDLNYNGLWDPIEPIYTDEYLTPYHRLRADSAYFKWPLITTHQDSLDFESLRVQDSVWDAQNYDADVDGNGVADPRTTAAISRTIQTIGGKATNMILYGQSDAWTIEVPVWAESKGVVTESPEQFILPIVKDDNN